MTPKISLMAGNAGMFIGATLLAALTGCVTDNSTPTSGNQVRTTVRVQAAFGIVDDYDYYPGYEVYYSRSRREYVYLEGNAWVRRPAPRGVTVDLLFASPSVRMDFRDLPEQHHASVVRTYPRNWSPPGSRRDDRAPTQVVIQRPPVQTQTTIVIVDDYDYYPGYEVYYSRSRHEYVYLEGNAWVRRPSPRGVSVDLFFASPSVRMDFRDLPEHHHGSVVRSYPKNWAPPGRGRGNKDRDDNDRDDKNDRRDDKNNDRKPDGRKD